jgi:hypothetical protein
VTDPAFTGGPQEFQRRVEEAFKSCDCILVFVDVTTNNPQQLDALDRLIDNLGSLRTRHGSWERPTALVIPKGDELKGVTRSNITNEKEMETVLMKYPAYQRIRSRLEGQKHLGTIPTFVTSAVGPSFKKDKSIEPLNVFEPLALVLKQTCMVLQAKRRARWAGRLLAATLLIALLSGSWLIGRTLTNRLYDRYEQVVGELKGDENAAERMKFYDQHLRGIWNPFWNVTGRSTLAAAQAKRDAEIVQAQKEFEKFLDHMSIVGKEAGDVGRHQTALDYQAGLKAPLLASAQAQLDALLAETQPAWQEDAETWVKARDYLTANESDCLIWQEKLSKYAERQFGLHRDAAARLAKPLTAFRKQFERDRILVAASEQAKRYVETNTFLDQWKDKLPLAAVTWLEKTLGESQPAFEQDRKAWIEVKTLAVRRIGDYQPTIDQLRTYAKRTGALHAEEAIEQAKQLTASEKSLREKDNAAFARARDLPTTSPSEYLDKLKALKKYANAEDAQHEDEAKNLAKQVDRAGFTAATNIQIDSPSGYVAKIKALREYAAEPNTESAKKAQELSDVLDVEKDKDKAEYETLLELQPAQTSATICKLEKRARTYLTSNQHLRARAEAVNAFLRNLEQFKKERNVHITIKNVTMPSDWPDITWTGNPDISVTLHVNGARHATKTAESKKNGENFDAKIEQGIGTFPVTFDKPTELVVTVTIHRGVFSNDVASETFKAQNILDLANGSLTVQRSKANKAKAIIRLECKDAVAPSLPGWGW